MVSQVSTLKHSIQDSPPFKPWIPAIFGLWQCHSAWRVRRRVRVYLWLTHCRFQWETLFRPAETALSDDEDAEEDAEEGPHYSFPELDAQIREAIKEYGAVFPKLNFSSPKVRVSYLHDKFSKFSVLRMPPGFYLRRHLWNALVQQMSIFSLSRPILSLTISAKTLFSKVALHQIVSMNWSLCYGSGTQSIGVGSSDASWGRIYCWVRYSSL